MIRTRVGYAGGQMHDPDYGNIGDHTETVQVDFDPRRISYAELLNIFWSSHKPVSRSWSRQYMNAIFYHDENQKQAALSSKAEVEQKIGRPVPSQVLPLGAFYSAEDYHQKYILKRHTEYMRDLSRIYPRHPDLVNSTAAARINGYLGEYGSQAQLSREIAGLGLRPEMQQRLQEFVRKHEGEAPN